MAAKSPDTIAVIGLSELVKALKDADPNVAKAIRKAMKTAAQTAVAHQRARAPHRSGALAASIRASAGMKSATASAGGTSRVQYAGPINFGWARHNIKAQEFMYAGLADARDEISEAFTSELESALSALYED